MDDLVTRLPKEAAMLREIAQSYSRGIEWQANLSASAAMADLAAARIQALETSLAEAMATRVDKARAWDACIEARNDERAKVIAEVVAWLNNASIWLNGGECCGQKCSDGVCCAPACIWGDELKLLHSVATALETGEWKK